MRIAMAIFRLSPIGGAEEVCMRLADELARRDHEVTLFTTVPAEIAGVTIRKLPAQHRFHGNHARMQRFGEQLAAACAHNFDRTVAFQPLPGVDVLFCADLMRNRPDAGLIRRIMPRFRTYARLEAACFSTSSRTRLLCLSEMQTREYVERYHTPAERIAIVPPMLDPRKRQPQRRVNGRREAMRARLGLPPDARVWLWCGLQPRIKGLDRVIDALALNADARLIIGGLNEHDRKSAPILARAKKAGVANRMAFLGYLGLDELLDSFAAADVLAHPARAEVTGGVILEALVNGLPVVTTENCGFAAQVREAAAGIVINQPFDLQEFVHALERAASTPEFSANGAVYGVQDRLYCGITHAADLIEQPFWNAAA